MTLQCNTISISQPMFNEENNCFLSTLAFSVVFPEPGEYDVSRISIMLHDKRIVEREMGSIIFISEVSEYQKFPIFAKKFF